MDTPNPTTLAEQGKQEYQQGNFAAAAKLFSQAAQAYEELKDGLNAAEMKNNQSVALLQAGKSKEALQAVEGTEEIFEQANDLKRLGVAIANRAAALEGLKEWDEALAEYDRAASIFEQANEGDMHSTVRKAMSGLNLRLGRITASQLDAYDSARLVKQPSLAQRMMKFMKRIGLLK